MVNKLIKFIGSKLKVVVAFVFIFSLFLFSGCLKSNNPQYKVDLEVWGVFDSSDVLDRLASEYKKINPHIGEIRYRKFTVDSYKKDLIDALASGQSPDIFWIHNTWLPSFQDKVEPSSEIILGEKQFRENFVDVVANDFLANNKVYAVPLSVDSLALYYNKDLLNSQGITTPPKTWDEFNAAVRKLTRIDQFDNITQAGAALGTAYNINRSTDVLGLLMFQNGVNMVNDEKTEASIEKPVNAGEKSIRAGENAVEFYTQFARKNSSVYTWNPRMHYSIDSFYEGTTAMMINYSWHYNTIKNKNSKLNFAVAPVPQLNPENPSNYANYWGMAVSRNKILGEAQKKKIVENGLTDGNYNKVRLVEAWQLIKYLGINNNKSMTLYNGLTGNSQAFAIKDDPTVAYLEETIKPAARRDIIEKQKQDPILGPFAYGNLIAKSWYQKDPETSEQIIAQTINSVNLGEKTIYEALRLASNRISQLMRK